MDELRECMDALFVTEDDEDNPLSFLIHRPEFITLAPPIHFARDEVKYILK